MIQRLYHPVVASPVKMRATCFAAWRSIRRPKPRAFACFPNPEEREEAAVVEVSDRPAPGLDVPEVTALVAAQRRRGAGADRVARGPGAVHRQEETAREDRIDEAEGVAHQRPAVPDPAQGRELVVAVAHDRREPPAALEHPLQMRIRAQERVVLLLGLLAQRTEHRGIGHDAERNPSRQRNPPAPAVLQSIRVHVPRVIEHDALAVGEERHVAAVLPVAGKIEQPGEQARTAARVDDPIRGAAETLRGGREGLGAEPHARIAWLAGAPGDALDLRARLDDPGAAALAGRSQRRVEAVARARCRRNRESGWQTSSNEIWMVKSRSTTKVAPGL